MGGIASVCAHQCVSYSLANRYRIRGLGVQSLAKQGNKDQHCIQYSSILHSATVIIRLQYPDLLTSSSNFTLHHSYSTEQNFSLKDVFAPVFYVDCNGVSKNNIPKGQPRICKKRLWVKATRLKSAGKSLDFDYIITTSSPYQSNTIGLFASMRSILHSKARQWKLVLMFL